MIDLEGGTVDLEVDGEVLGRRRAAWAAPPLVASGMLARYVRTVGDASGGCVTDARGGEAA